MASEIQEIQDAIHKIGAKWTATETEFIKTVDAEQRSHRLGVVLDQAALERIRQQPQPDMAGHGGFDRKVRAPSRLGA